MSKCNTFKQILNLILCLYKKYRCYTNDILRALNVMFGLPVIAIQSIYL